MAKSPFKAVSDVKVRVLLDRYRCPVPFHAVRTRFLGDIASPVMSAPPLVGESAMGRRIARVRQPRRSQ